jgi:hypothetical protein
MKIIPIIPTWSYSRLSTFEACKLHAKIQYVDKIPEPERPLPPGKTEHANDRGTRLHTEAELFVQGKGPFTPGLIKFQPEFESMKLLHARGMVSLEGDWAHKRDWEIADWSGPDTWLRLKLDSIVFLTPQEAVVVDYKSGRRYGNEIKHAEQTQLYQLSAFLRYPQLEYVTTELWYLDQDEIAANTYTRAQGLRFRSTWDRRGNAMTTAQDFPANPSIFSCRYCPYGPRGTGHCTRGV